MLINQRIRIKLDKESEEILDSQSLMCSKMYNMLLELCNKNEDPTLLKGWNLRNRMVKIKQEHRYFYAVYPSPLKNTALRLKDAFVKFFNKQAKYPKFHSNKRSWFSLLYDEPNKGIKINNRHIKISLGYVLDEEGKKKRIHIDGILEEKVKKNISIRNYRIIKKQKRYYLVICMDVKEKERKEINNKAIAIDPNHKNFFVGIDNEGRSMEMENIPMIRYFDKQIDKVKSKRDRCLRKSVKVENKEGKVYFKPSRRYKRLDRVLDKLYFKREEQIKTALYTISHYLCREYGKIAIGDYTPTIEVSKQKRMHRSMLNETIIGRFRDTLEYVAKKEVVDFNIVDEKDTTKTCSICGDIKVKGPNIREFICPKCGRLLYRDINSAINIGVKSKLLSSSDYEGIDLSKPLYTARYDLRNQEHMLLELNK